MRGCQTLTRPSIPTLNELRMLTDFVRICKRNIRPLLLETLFNLTCNAVNDMSNKAKKKTLIYHTVIEQKQHTLYAHDTRKHNKSLSIT